MFKIKKRIFEIKKTIFEIKKTVFEIKKTIFEIKKTIFEIKKAKFSPPQKKSFLTDISNSLMFKKYYYDFNYSFVNFNSFSSEV